jgi:hypothetical protein
MWWVYMATGLVTLFLVVVRGLTVGFRPERAPRPDHARPPRPGVRSAQHATPVPETVPVVEPAGGLLDA